jgi:hypothetical protein
MVGLREQNDLPTVPNVLLDPVRASEAGAGDGRFVEAAREQRVGAAGARRKPVVRGARRSEAHGSLAIRERRVCVAEPLDRGRASAGL